MSSIKRKLLLLSSSYVHGYGFLEHSQDHIREFFKNCKQIAFVPYAAKDMDKYAELATTTFQKLFNLPVVSVHDRTRYESAAKAVEASDGIFVGGGNTFRLLNSVYTNANLLNTIRKRVLQDGVPYMGSSAGTNIAGLTIKTTNDMPIVFPPSFDALQLIPIQLNPHYLDADPTSKHKGETREQRLTEFHEENDTTVVAIREGAIIHAQDDKVTLIGANGGRVFCKEQGKLVIHEIADNADLSKYCC